MDRLCKRSKSSLGGDFLRSFYGQKKIYGKKKPNLPLLQREKEDISRKRNKKPQIFLIVFILFYFFLLCFTQFVRHLQINSELSTIKDQIAQVNEENAVFREEIELLHNLEYLEELARGRLGMARPGEMLFYISTDEND